MSMTVKTLESMRSEESFSLFWKKTLDQSQQFEVGKRKLPRQ